MSPSHAQNTNSNPQVQPAQAAPAATDVKTMASAPMAPVSVSKGGMESKLLLLSYVVAPVLLVFVFNVVVVVLVICPMASRLLLNTIMMIVDNFGC